MSIHLRNTGLDPVGERPWGTHICLFYETRQDLYDVHVEYFGAGLASGEFCIWAVSDPIDRETAIDALRKSVPDFEKYLRDGQIEIIPGYQWYLRGDEFDAQRITGGWHAKLDEALARGFEGMRVSGECVLVRDQPLENILRIRGGTRPFARRPENDCTLHLLS